MRHYTTDDGNEEEIATVTRKIARLNNASAHGRVSGILRGYYEAGEQRFWLGRRRSGVDAALERLSFHWVAAQTTASIAYLICARWSLLAVRALTAVQTEPAQLLASPSACRTSATTRPCRTSPTDPLPRPRLR